MVFKQKKYLILIFLIVSLFLILFRKDYYYSQNSFFTILKPLKGDEVYLIDGFYINIIKPKKEYIKLHKGKILYLCKNCDSTVIYLGSEIVERKGLRKYKFISHKSFFKLYRGESYLNGKFKRDSTYNDKVKKYEIQYIEF